LGKRGKEGEGEGTEWIWANRIIGTKLRPHLRYLVRRLHRQGNGAKRAEEAGISSLPPFLFVCSAYSTELISFVLRSGWRMDGRLCISEVS
jgi:hypothetical protein